MQIKSAARAALLLFMSTLIMSFAWPVRGQFGHAWGAMITGVCAGSIMSLLPPFKAWRRIFPQTIFFGVIGFVIGGENLPYGALINQILEKPHLSSALPELFIILFIGATWGCIGATYLGYGISDAASSLKDYVLIILAGILTIAVIEIMNERTPHMTALIFLILFLHIYNLAFKRSQVIAGMGLAGLLSFGLGFLAAVIILYAGRHGFFPGTNAWWSLRDQIWGGIGGMGLGIFLLFLIKKNHLPKPIESLNFKRCSFILFLPLTGLINTFNVYEKWFLKGPQVSALNIALIILGIAITFTAACFVFCALLQKTLLEGKHYNKLLLASFLLFTVFISVLAVSKSIVYYGHTAWETAFDLFIYSNVLFALLMPWILLKQKDL